MGNTILYILLGVVFVAFMGFIAYAVITGRRQKGEAPVARLSNVQADDVTVKVTKEPDGIKVYIYNSYEERPSDAEIFPDIPNDLEPPKGALDRDFWEQVANMAFIEDPAERERIATVLAEHGLIPKEAVNTWAMPAPEGFNPQETEEEIPEEPYHAVLDEVTIEPPKEGDIEINY